MMSTDERMKKMAGELARIRWFNRCLIACIVLSLGVWFISKTFTPETAWAQSGLKEIRANRFVLEDVKGKTRAVLEVGVNITDINVPEGFILESKEGAGLVLGDENGKTRAALSVFRDNGPALRLFDENGKERTRLSANDVWLTDEKAKPRVRLGVVKEGPAGLALFDENDKECVSLVVTKDGPALALRDENEKTRAVLGTEKTQTPNGKVISFPESSLILFGPDGKVIWSAP